MLDTVWKTNKLHFESHYPVRNAEGNFPSDVVGKKDLHSGRLKRNLLIIQISAVYLKLS